MTSYLTAFNTVVFNFNDDLIQTFPEENDFKVYRRGLEWLKESNAKKYVIYSKFILSITEKKSKSKDETFFLNTTYDDVVDTENEGIVLVINKLKKYWCTFQKIIKKKFGIILIHYLN